MSDYGAVFYRGPSLLTGEPVVGIVTGLAGTSHNPKTGPIAQAWVLRPDKTPMEAVADGSDDAICGECALRGDGKFGRTCYVTYWQAALMVYRSFVAGDYVDASWPEAAALLEGRSVRIAAYGDPAALPFEVWDVLLTHAGGWVAYTHQWRTCDRRLRAFCMASVDTEAEFWAARAAHWRTFRVRGQFDGLMQSGFGQALEAVCPASDEGNHQSTCEQCQLCRGLGRQARSIAIVAHGKPGNVAAFYRSRQEATA